jgi:hypothetical protein
MLGSTEALIVARREARESHERLVLTNERLASAVEKLTGENAASASTRPDRVLLNVGTKVRRGMQIDPFDLPPSRVGDDSAAINRATRLSCET